MLAEKRTSYFRPVALVVTLTFLLFAVIVFETAYRSARQPVRYIYLLDYDNGRVIPYPVTGGGGSEAQQVKQLIQALLSRSSKEPKSRRVVPEGTQLLHASVAGGVATLNFNSAMKQTGFWPGAEHEYLCLQAIVFTATQLPGVKSVRFLVEGQEVESLGGHVGLTEPVERDKNLLTGGSGGTG